MAKSIKKIRFSIKRKPKEITAEPRKRANFDQGYAERAWSGGVNAEQIRNIQSSTNIGSF